MKKYEMKRGGRTLQDVMRTSKRAKRMRITIGRDTEATVTVTRPRRISMRVVERFVKEKSEWIFATQEKSKQRGSGILHNGTRKTYMNRKEEARALATERLQYFSTQYGLTYNRLSIRDQKTRWGSCSTKRNLNFNYRIVFLPPRLLDYIIVHELCHLRHLNHGPRFWRLMEQELPDARQRSKELRVL